MCKEIPVGSSVPACYQSATWRNTTKKDEVAQCIGVGFDLAHGGTIRLSLSTESATQLMESLADYLTASSQNEAQ